MERTNRYIFAFLTTLLTVQLVTGEAASPGLADPAVQAFFSTEVPNPLDPSFVFDTSSGSIQVSVSSGTAETGLMNSNGESLTTPIWGYGTDDLGHTWPGRTFEVRSFESVSIQWMNKIPIEDGFLLTGKDNGEFGDFTGRSVVDESLHWAYSLPGYTEYTIENDGTPIVVHIHGEHSDAPYDGNPEYFFSPGYDVRGPQWVEEVYHYENDQPAAALWYHDHALGITRLNVHAGMAGFYIIRDDKDTGKPDNPLKLPAYPYEIPLVVQDRMYKENGELFYPAFPGDPYYTDFIDGEGAEVDGNSPSALAEFFGDFIVVNGKNWPKMNVEPRAYRLRILNGCDSRFFVLRMLLVDDPTATTGDLSGEYISFTVIGGDQGLSSSPSTVTSLVVEPSARYDIIVNFSDSKGKRVVMMNEGGDEPFGGDIPGPQVFNFTDRIMAFDVEVNKDLSTPDDFEVSASLTSLHRQGYDDVDNRRRLALFEGRDQFGRLLPLVGTVDPAEDMNGDPINWPDNEVYRNADLVGQMQGAATWHAPITENPKLGDTEEWEIWNLSADAHPIHLHLVHFEVVRRQFIVWDSAATESGEIVSSEGMEPAGDGTYLEGRVVVAHDGGLGGGFIVKEPTYGADVNPASLPEYVETFPKDTVVALPGQILTIRAKFDKPGRFNWHCHILAHEDHEMMRVFHVGPLPVEVDHSIHTMSNSNTTAPLVLDSTESKVEANGVMASNGANAQACIYWRAVGSFLIFILMI